MHRMGGNEDIKTRTENIRVDSKTRQDKVKAARKLIYNKGYATTYEGVENLLKEESYVPTEVR